MARVHPVLRVPIYLGPISITSKKSGIAHHSDPLPGKLQFSWPLTARYKHLGLHHVLAIQFQCPAGCTHSELAPSLPAVRAAPQRPIVITEAVTSR